MREREREREKENKSWIYREKDRAREGERVREEERLLLRKEKIAFTMIVTSPNFYIHVSVSDLYIPRIGPRI